MNHSLIVCCCVFFICNFFLLDQLMGEDLSLNENLEAILHQVNDSDKNFDKQEQELLNLFPQYDSARDKGKILATIAILYSQKLTSHTAKVVDYCSKAVQYPLESLAACDVYLMWGKALEAEQRLSSDTEPKVDARTRLSVPYIKAMDLILQNLKIKKKISPPAVGKFDVTPKDPSYEEVKKRHKEQMLHRKDAMEQNNLLNYKRIFRERLVELYASTDSVTVEADVHEVIQNSSRAAQICDALKNSD